MGREAHIMLAILGLLAGAFFGVLSVKLLSPRPPAGAGPDIHDHAAIATPAEIVDPPSFDRVPATTAIDDDPAAPTGGRYAAAASRFAAPAAAEDAIQARGVDEPSQGPTSRSRDPFAARHTNEPLPLDEAAVEAAMPIERDEPTGRAAASMVAPSSDTPHAAAFAPSSTVPASHVVTTPEVTRYVTVAGDSWWSLAEQMYGDGRLYRALFAWNKSINPRVSLVPGTPLELPPKSQLATAWPGLMPNE